MIAVDKQNLERELRYLRRVRDVAQKLASERQPERVLKLILDSAIEITTAERGFLVLVRERSGGGQNLHVQVARGFDKTALRSSANSVSRTVVERVLSTGEGVVTTSEDHRDLIDVTSVKDRHVLSIVSVPLRVRGELRGILYMDHRFRPGAFDPDDLPILTTFADQAGLAMETAEWVHDRSRAPAHLRPTLEQLAQLSDDDEAPRPETAEPVEAFGELVGGAASMGALYQDLERAARSDAPALILGEVGSGKSLVAAEIHRRSARASEPFVVMACDGRGEELESELLGHVSGARPWAHSDRRGSLVLAGKGTLVLDEVGELSWTLQARLVRALREGAVTPLGGDRPRPIRCRVLATSRADPQELVRRGRLQPALYYQLDALRLIVPPLRQRPEDIPRLVEHFKAAQGRPRLRFSANALEVMQLYHWPGNVHELENEVARQVGKSPSKVTGPALSEEIRSGRGVTRAPAGYAGKTLGEVEADMVRAALESCDGNKARAARQLGIPRSTLYHLLERHDLA